MQGYMVSYGETVARRNKVRVALLDGVAKMPLYSPEGVNADLFGDAYAYRMGMYAANAGKKGGQSFTPADVSELLTRLGTIGKTTVNKVCDIKILRLIQFNYSSADFAA